MAKKRRNDRRVLADSIPPVSRPLVLRRTVRRVSPVVLSSDRRVFHPEGVYRPLRSVVRKARRLVVARPPKVSKKYSVLSHRLGFAIPGQVYKCVQRKVRRQIMFAFKLNGKGAGAKHRRRDEWSDVKC